MGNMNGGIDIDCLVLEEPLVFYCIGLLYQARWGEDTRNVCILVYHSLSLGCAHEGTR